MRLRTRIAAALFLLLPLPTHLFAGELVNVSGADKIALAGYDPVAFFTDSKAVKGSPQLTASYQGAVYQFASEEHRMMFQKSPGAFVPQYGGYCAYGVSVGGLAPVDIATWQVRNGKLYLNKNQEILGLFNADFDGNVAKAQRNWPGIVAKEGK